MLDGWGCAPPGPGNAVELAETPVFDRLWAEDPHTTLEASGEAVGLPPGQMGNSEVGHLTIGSGRRLYQDLARVNHAVTTGSLAENPALSVNGGYDKNGFPIGVQIVGRRFDDIGVLAMAKAFEGLRGPQRPWPSPPKK